MPISALIFGGRRRELAPLVYEARNWQHGVLVGASVASETTAAATGKVGVVRRDPMAMKPFSGYNFADYWAHWLKVGAALRIRRASSTSTGSARMRPANSCGRVSARTCACWPGCSIAAPAMSARLDTPIGNMPRPGDLNTAGLDISREALAELTAVPNDAWRKEIADLRQYLKEYGSRLPAAMLAELDEVARRLRGRLALLADEINRQRRVAIRRSAQADQPSPLIGMLSRRTKASSSPIICTKVPLVL